jgi:glycosyltransferase involved in cell wall biosynthesis
VFCNALKTDYFQLENFIYTSSRVIKGVVFLSKKIAIIHFTIYPVIGGVEILIDQHARLLADRGYDIELFVAQGQKFDPRVKVTVVPEIDCTSKDNMEVRQKLEKENTVIPKFEVLSKDVYKVFKKLLADKDYCVIHNMQTNQLHIPAAKAFRKLATELPTKFIAWCHDHVLLTPYYADKDKDKYPWTVISEKDKNMNYVVVSKTQQKHMAKLFGVDKKQLKVVPNGVPIKNFLIKSDFVYNFFVKNELFKEHLIMLMPSRVVPRKNIEYGIKLLAEIKKKHKFGKIIITGKAHAQRPELRKYYHDLKQLALDHGLEKDVIWLSEQVHKGKEVYIDDQMIVDLFQVCDALLFPSIKEGFGIPLLEASLVRMPAICSNIEVHQELGFDHIYVDINKEPKTHVDKVVDFYKQNPMTKNRKRVLANYSWDSIYEDHLEPLFKD